jgi:2-amino-4-hydroxy-6-hydroxymethyldihydropteridine diphosphokinase
MRAGGEIVYVAVGANLGDREAIFAAVIRSIELEKDLLLLAASPVFETAPVGPAGQDSYLNAALELRTWLGPLELLGRLQAIEKRLGRDRGPEAVRWGPRRIDLDLLFYGDRCIDLPELVVPHPRAHERAFVMRPMAELAPGFWHPVLGVSVVEIARGRPDTEEVRLRPRPEGWPGSRVGISRSSGGG